MATTYERVLPLICEAFYRTANEINTCTPIEEISNALARLDLVLSIEKAFGISLGQGELEENCTDVGDIADLIDAKLIAKEAA